MNEKEQKEIPCGGRKGDKDSPYGIKIQRIWILC
jgi:hypothetical protein